jgi:hypothetical protein
MKFSLVLTFLIASQTLFAALPPLAQSIREIQSILSAKELKNLLNSAESIETISRLDGGYLVITNKSFIEVRIQYLERNDQLAGPLEYRLEFRKVD